MILITPVEMQKERLMVNWVKFMPCWAIMNKPSHAWSINFKMQGETSETLEIILVHIPTQGGPNITLGRSSIFFTFILAYSYK